MRLDFIVISLRVIIYLNGEMYTYNVTYIIHMIKEVMEM